MVLMYLQASAGVITACCRRLSNRACSRRGRGSLCFKSFKEKEGEGRKEFAWVVRGAGSSRMWKVPDVFTVHERDRERL